MADFLSSLLASLADLNKTDRVAYQCRRIIAFPHSVGHSMPVAPLRNPQNFFRGSRDEARLRELFHTMCNQRTYDAAFCLKLQWVEGERIASSIRQRRQMGEPFRIIQHADHPEMIELALRASRINRMEREGNRVAGKVEGCDFGSPKIIGFHRPTQLHRFHNQSGKFRHPGTNVEPAATSS